MKRKEKGKCKKQERVEQIEDKGREEKGGGEKKKNNKLKRGREVERNDGC